MQNLLLQEMYKQLDLYVRLMEDHSQACYLQSLGKDVDSHRFTADNEYKRETILSLAKYVSIRALCRVPSGFYSGYKPGLVFHPEYSILSLMRYYIRS